MNTPATPNTRTMKPPPRKTPRPRDRVTDNRAAFLQRLETLRSGTRRSHDPDQLRLSGDKHSKKNE